MGIGKQRLNGGVENDTRSLDRRLTGIQFQSDS